MIFLFVRIRVKKLHLFAVSEVYGLPSEEIFSLMDYQPCCTWQGLAPVQIFREATLSTKFNSPTGPRL